MKKNFEDYFSEMQADMVGICLEYVEKRAERVFIYCSFEENVVFSNFFFKVNEHVVKKNELNNVIRQGDKLYDISLDRQKTTISIINDNIKQINMLCNENDREMPTQVKLIYDVRSNSVQAEYKYELMHSREESKSANDIFEEWFIQESIT